LKTWHRLGGDGEMGVEMGMVKSTQPSPSSPRLGWTVNVCVDNGRMGAGGGRVVLAGAHGGIG